MKLVLLSDTHGMHHRVHPPDGDVLIFAGDFTRRHSEIEIYDFNSWLGSLPHRHKIVIAGNHDWCFQHGPAARAVLTNATYLQDEACVVEGVKIYGAPWQPRSGEWAFNLDRGEALRRKWAAIPVDTEVLVTHGPAAGHGDRTYKGEHTGCQDLAAAIKRVRPRLHVCGHIHEGYGVRGDAHTVYINASVCTARYEPTNPPITFELALLERKGTTE